MTIKQEFKKITDLKATLPNEVYVKYLENIIKIQLKYIETLER